MAQKTPAAPRFYEVVFQGKPKVVKAFLKGLMMGADHDASLYYSYDEGVHHEGKAEHLKEMFGLRGTDCHVIVDGDASAFLKKKAKVIAKATGLTITAHRGIRSASMEFSYTAYAPRYHGEITGLLKSLPKGLRLRGFEHSENIDPSAKGIEAYTAGHDFEATGHGTVSGRIDLLIQWKRSLADYPLIAADDIELN